MIDLETAKKIVQEDLDSIRKYEDDRFVIIDEATIEKSYGWIFFFNSKKFLETGDFLYALGGNGPIAVEKETGQLHKLGTAHPSEYYIKEFERKKGYS